MLPSTEAIMNALFFEFEQPEYAEMLDVVRESVSEPELYASCVNMNLITGFRLPLSLLDRFSLEF